MTLIRKPIYKNHFKRPLDVFGASLAIVALSPVLVTTSILVNIKHGSPVLFKQKRPGVSEQIFTMYKFRTMSNEKDSKGNLLPDGKRITTFGQFLRSTSLDELPELLNVLKGEMSMVGPRPQLVRDMTFMSYNQRQRHKVAPGITGLAQVSGRNSITWEEKLDLDLQYINDITFIKDSYIILQTVIQVFKKSGINSEGEDTAEDYGDYLLRNNKIDKITYEKNMQESKKLLLWS